MVDITEVKKYIEKYGYAESRDLKNEGIDAFLANYSAWQVVIDRIYGTERGYRIYGEAFVAFTICLYESDRLCEALAEIVSEEIRNYETKVDYAFGEMNSLCFNMGLIWHKLGKEYDDCAVEEFKRSIYYLLALSNNTSYTVDCYAFRPCTKYLYHSLVKEQLNLSSPTQFNDPFDCPIMELLNNHGDEVSRLMHQAYRYTTKVACFVNNLKLPTYDDFTRKPKHEGDEPEFLNELMWAHYADAHKGVCIKYHIPNTITIHPKCGMTELAYFRDVRYSDDLYDTGKADEITMKDAFFLKSKAWEYENELRYLYFDLNGKFDYHQVSIPNCVAAVYFGLKCPEEEREFIMKLMAGKTWVNRYSKIVDSKKVDYADEMPIDFFQIKLDGERFGKLKAEKI